jgi:hypothetical protein
MIGKLDVRVPRNTLLTPEFQEVDRHAFADSLDPFRRSRWEGKCSSSE